jgi:hypothetical protein
VKVKKMSAGKKKGRRQSITQIRGDHGKGHEEDEEKLRAERMVEAKKTASG